MTEGMSTLDRVLHWGPVSRVRRNHALEHATLQVLAEKDHNLRAAGYSDPKGFWLLGELETPQVEEAVQEALIRMRNGEHNLAIHPNCGTNLVTTGFIAGALAWLGMLSSERSQRNRWERLPMVMSLATIGMLLAQPVGPYIQKHVTTDAVSGDLEVVSIEKTKRGDVPLHRVLTRF